MLEWMNRHSVVTWAIAWGVTGVGFFTADVFSHPRQGPLWVGLVFGLVAWSAAGAVTLHRERRALGAAVWAGAYVVGFWAGAVWGAWFENNAVGSMASAGFVGALLGWAAGGAVGALVSGYVGASPRRLLEPVIFAVAWGISFLIAGFVGLVMATYMAQAAKSVLAFLGGERAALTIGFALGAGLGGALASTLGLAAHDAIIGSRRTAV